MEDNKKRHQEIYVESSIWNGLKAIVKVVWYGGITLLLIIGFVLVGR